MQEVLETDAGQSSQPEKLRYLHARVLDGHCSLQDVVVPGQLVQVVAQGSHIWCILLDRKAVSVRHTTTQIRYTMSNIIKQALQSTPPVICTPGGFLDVIP